MVSPFQNGKNERETCRVGAGLSLKPRPSDTGDLSEPCWSRCYFAANLQQLLQIAYPFVAQWNQRLLPELRRQERVGERLIRILWSEPIRLRYRFQVERVRRDCARVDAYRKVSERLPCCAHDGFRHRTDLTTLLDHRSCDRCPRKSKRFSRTQNTRSGISRQSYDHPTIWVQLTSARFGARMVAHSQWACSADVD